MSRESFHQVVSNLRTGCTRRPVAKVTAKRSGIRRASAHGTVIVLSLHQRDTQRNPIILNIWNFLTAFRTRQRLTVAAVVSGGMQQGGLQDKRVSEEMRWWKIPEEVSSELMAPDS